MTYCEKCGTNLIGKTKIKSMSTINGLLCIPCNDKIKKQSEKSRQDMEKWLKNKKR